MYVNEGDISNGNTVAGPFQGLKPFNGPWSSFLQLKISHTMSDTIECFETCRRNSKMMQLKPLNHLFVRERKFS